MQGMSTGRIIMGVGIVGAGGVVGWFAGAHWKRPKTGAALGIVAGIGVNYALAASMAASTTPEVAASQP